MCHFVEVETPRQSNQRNIEADEVRGARGEGSGNNDVDSEFRRK